MRMFHCQVAVPGDPHVESAWKIWKARWSWNFHGMSYGITMLTEDQPNNFIPACELVRYIAWCTKYHVNKCEYGSILGYQLNHSIYHLYYLYYLVLYLSNQWVYQTLILILPHSSNHIKQSNLGRMNSVPCTSMGARTRFMSRCTLSRRSNRTLASMICHICPAHQENPVEIHPVDGWAHQLRWSLKLGYRKWLGHFLGNRTQFLIEVDLLVIFPLNCCSHQSSPDFWQSTPQLTGNIWSNWASEHTQHTDAAQGICHIFHLSCWQADDGLNPGEDQMDRIWYETYICM